jgi:unspecific monooxygenase
LSLLMVLSHDQVLQNKIRKGAGSQMDPLLHAVIHETLRLYPPIPQLINRRVAQPCTLRLPSNGTVLEVPLDPGTYVGWSAFGMQRGPWATAWQPDPAVFRPERWGSSVEEIDALARRTRSSGEFATFHGGLRACECV